MRITTESFFEYANALLLSKKELAGLKAKFGNSESIDFDEALQAIIQLDNDKMTEATNVMDDISHVKIGANPL